MLTLGFAVGVAAGGVIVATLAATLASDARFWPPGERDWRFYLHWGCVYAFNAAILAVAYLDWGAWTLPLAGRAAGAVLALVGMAVFVYSGRVFTTEETMGMAGDLHTDGPYARSRNPQYVGMIVGMVGFVLLADSRFVAVLGALNVCWVLLLPFAEEPWLRAEFGEAYEAYAEDVPRFVGWRTLTGE